MVIKHTSKEKINPLVRASLVVLMIAVGLMLLLAACTSQQPNDAATISDANHSPLTPPQVGSNDSTRADVATNMTKPSEQVTQETMATLIADGTYSELVDYDYHSGTDTVNITLSFKNDIVTDASVIAVEVSKTSQRYISGVNAALPDLVIGKHINEIDLPKQISGSSLTVAAFKSQLQKIIDEN